MYKVEVNAEQTSRHFVVTNMKGLPIHLYRLYCDRGTAETFIDEVKNALQANRLSCRRFVANAFRLVTFALAYNLLRVYRSKLCGTVLEGTSIETVRSRLLKVGARMLQTWRRVWVQIAGGFPYREVLGLVMERIQGMAVCVPRTGRPNAPPAGASAGRRANDAPFLLFLGERYVPGVGRTRADGPCGTSMARSPATPSSFPPSSASPGPS